jgi:hypothetical protein
MPAAATKTWHEALLEVQRNLPPVKMNQTGQIQNRKYPYADLKAVTEALFPVLTENGFVYITALGVDAVNKPVLICTLRHISGGDGLQSHWPLPETTDPQKLGAAVTYGRRYALVALVGLVADADTDGQMPDEPEPERERPRQAQKQGESPWKGPKQATNEQRLEVEELAAKLDWDAGRLAQEAKANDPTWDERTIPTYAQAQALLLMLRQRVNADG